MTDLVLFTALVPLAEREKGGGERTHMGMDTKNEDTDSGGSRDRARLERSSEATTSGEEQILSNGNGNGDADQGGRSTETHWRKIRTSFSEENETSPAGVGGGGGGGGTSSSGGATRKGGGMKQVISNVMHKAANSHLNILRRSQADLELYDCGPTMVRISAPAHTQWALHSLPDRFSIYVHAARIDLLSCTHVDVMLVKCLVSPSLSLCMYLSVSCSPSVRQCAAHTRAGVSASGTKRVARQESIAGACICSRQRHVHDFKEFRAVRTTCGEMQLCSSELLTTIRAPQPLFACVHIYIYAFSLCHANIHSSNAGRNYCAITRRRARCEYAEYILFNTIANACRHV